ncbi:hypothetical protein [Rhizobium sp.]|uniref:hypothetical protein n=1 Tax=Rhizobium sp. TaxID=391 RepID=UPI003F7FE40E
MPTGPVYDIKDLNIKKFALYYENNKTKLLLELRLVKRLLPEHKTSMESFVEAANDILQLRTRLVQPMVQGDGCPSLPP